MPPLVRSVAVTTETEAGTSIRRSLVLVAVTTISASVTPEGLDASADAASTGPTGSAAIAGVATRAAKATPAISAEREVVFFINGTLSRTPRSLPGDTCLGLSDR